DRRASQYDHAVYAGRLVERYRRIVHVGAEAVLVREIKIFVGSARWRIIDRNIRSQAPAQETVGDEKLLPAGVVPQMAAEVLAGDGPYRCRRKQAGEKMIPGKGSITFSAERVVEIKDAQANGFQNDQQNKRNDNQADPEKAN